jgi:uncharacterized protein
VPAEAVVASKRPAALDRAGVGIGLRQPHYQRLLDEVPALGFVELHSENFFADGGAALAVLQQARERYPVSLHGVGLALGSAAGVDPWHLERLHRLVERTDPIRVSDHASFARVARAGLAPVHAADLLPIAYTQASLDILVRNVDAVQERLRRPILVENVSAYLSFADDSMDEPAFFESLCRRSGCRLLLDLNNVMVNAVNALCLEGASACGRRPAAARWRSSAAATSSTPSRRPSSARSTSPATPMRAGSPSTITAARCAPPSGPSSSMRCGVSGRALC